MQIKMNAQPGDSSGKSVIVACYHDELTPAQCLARLRKYGVHSSATLRRQKNDRYEIRNYLAARIAAGLVGAVLFLLLLFLSLIRSPLFDSTIYHLITHNLIGTIAVGALGAVAGFEGLILIGFGVRGRLIARLKQWVTPGETFVVVSVKMSEVQRTLSTLRENPEDLPSVFVFHGDRTPFENLADAPEAPGDASTDRLSARARTLAEQQKFAGRGKYNRILLDRLNESEAAFNRVAGHLRSAVRNDQRIELSAEWLLDNAYIVRGHIEEYRVNLPKNFYRELPVLAGGVNDGLPRVYEVAQSFVNETQARLTVDEILAYLLSYQVVTPLTMGELWALPLMLRLSLVEYLHHIINHVERRQIEREMAEFWSYRLIIASRHDPENLRQYIGRIARLMPHPSAYLAREMLNNLSDTPDVVAPLREWFDSVFGMPAPDAINLARNSHSIQQLSLVNTLSSLRLLAQSDWTSIFEQVSVVDLILRTDPSGTYHLMDYPTRDLYRKALEQLSRRSKISETELAELTIGRAETASAPLERHIGYHLIDKGRKELEAAINYRPPLLQSIQRKLSGRPFLSYAGPITVLTFVIFAGVLLAEPNTAMPWLLLLALMSLFPCSEIAVTIVNAAMTRIFEPQVLPKMSFEDGIPDEHKTLVVVPMMLLTPESIQQEIERLQIRALANPDKNLIFALLSDYSDAERQSMPEDAERLEVAKRGIQNLGERFLLFHRNREWSESEQRWMGFERKRGKLEDLNDYLTNHRTTPRVANLLSVGDELVLTGVQYVLTLDADTQLPRDTARKLVATMAHPLNRPVLNQDGRRVDRGYTIIQPRVITSLPSATETWFSEIFTDSRGIDPYTHAVSDVYQDLSGEGIYHGKGIYEPASFRALLSDRFPNQHLLSHDLIEGAHARVGLATDVELLDSFPGTPYAYTRREHRWIRGDWQIVDWIFNSVPSSDGTYVANPLSTLNRWKILDNLRRSMLAPMYTLLLLLSWLSSPNSTVWSGIVLCALLVPCAVQLIQQLTSSQWYRIFRSREPWSSIGRAAIWTSLMPYQAVNAVDAICRVSYRRLISHRLLLEWETAQQVNQSAQRQNINMLLRTIWIPVLSLFFLAALVMRPSAHATLTYLFLGFWVVSPFLNLWLGTTPHRDTTRLLSPTDRRMLRHIALRTWTFFDHFVGPGTHWLPPDNYQEDLKVEIAHRTSPTNIGMWLLSIISAQDLGFITLNDAVMRAQVTFETLERLEKYQGHLLNWYDTDNGNALHPRYVSMVDSGNLLGALWAFDHSFGSLSQRPFAAPAVFEAILDQVALIEESSLPDPQIGRLQQTIRSLQREASTPAANVNNYMTQIRTLNSLAEQLHALLNRPELSGVEIKQLSDQLCARIHSWIESSDALLGWVEKLRRLPESGLLSLGSDVHLWRRQALASNPSVQSLADGHIPGLRALLSMRGQKGMTGDVQLWLDQIEKAFSASQSRAQSLLREIDEVRSCSRTIADSMNMRFLYVPERRLFAVGFNVEDGRLDNFYYDLLASEARLGSFAAIAGGQVPVEHWFALGRPMGLAYGERVLLSWSGTMFEYLMPVLLTKNFDNSLLAHACEAAVGAQIRYGRKRGVPWGISEAGHSAVDARQIYQYHAFGVPGLGLKRDLEDDLVIAPYATALALAVNPKSAIQNLRRLSSMTRPRKKGTDSLLGPYGFYESIDYSRQRDKEGVRGVIVRSYMAHHQGMSLIAINNALNDNIMEERFHSDLRVRASESLLYERIPTAAIKPAVELAAPSNLNVTEPTSFVNDIQFDTPNTQTPRTHLLANNEYSLMVTNSGGGYSRWRNTEIVRWRSDTVSDSFGSFIYAQDAATGETWSTTFHPMDLNPENYSGIFTLEKAEFHCRHMGMEIVTEIVVSPEDNAEVRRLTIINRSQRERTIELTSCLELALNEHAADRSHPAFSKLFVETESLPDLGAIVAHRRPRSAGEATPWAAHVTSSNRANSTAVQFETDREKFIGRGRTPALPRAMIGQLSGTAGAVLDPIFSLRRRATVKADERMNVSFITIAGENRDTVVRLASKYSQAEAADRAIDLAWTDAQINLRQMRIQPEDAVRYQVLAAQMLYPDSKLRPSDDTLRSNSVPRSRLWAYGISGDLPIMLVIVRGNTELDLVRQAVRAHAYWRSRGLITDLIIVDQEPASYAMPIMDRLNQIIDSAGDTSGRDKPGGVFLRSATQIAPDDLTVMLSVSHIVLIAARGSLAQQLSISAPPASPVPAIPRHLSSDSYSSALPFMDLMYYNGIGGFTKDGKEYVIYLGDGISTPAPWVNVMANPNFGTMISETGAGVTWAANSQMNKLTPWSNDPVLDPSNDAIYIKDDDVGVFWTPTASPIREHDAYRARHGQGYTVHEHNSHGIEQELTTFVPVDDRGGAPIRVQILKLRNASSQRRHLNLTQYVTWVLGTTKEETQMSIATEWDNSARILLARNRASVAFGGSVAFIGASTPIESYTGDRSEFIGRNRSLAAPAALGRTRLSNRVGASLDPCGAIQTRIEIEPDEIKEVVFVLGEAGSVDEAISLVRAHCAPDLAANALHETMQWWERTLETVQIATPDRGTDFLINRWLLYQDISCRLWGRTAFYQSGGAMGFRDQLQDSMAVLYSQPELARKQILLSAARQFKEGDVQHWWHVPGGAGVRTRISDDLLWLPFVTAQYVRITGDIGILDEVVPFIEGHVLAEHEEESFYVPDVSQERSTLLDHCKRAIDKGRTAGPHGMPLFGTGDWNDGLNKVGAGGIGESVWLAWFLVHVLTDMAELVTVAGDAASAHVYREQAHTIAKAVEESAWDGAWYLRGIYDDGTPLGSHSSDEMQIDSLPQSWAVISGSPDPQRAKMALKSVLDRLVDSEAGLVKLFTPAFEKTEKDPGYIKGYVAGVRENGGQYTHGSLWVPMALARSGDGETAVKLLNMMSPVVHGSSEANLPLYRVEPYVVVADIYTLAGEAGRGGWTWYTGSAGWMYRVWLEEVLGFKKRGAFLELDPRVPGSWESFQITYKYITSVYRINCTPDTEQKGRYGITSVDGTPVESSRIALVDDGREHHVEVKYRSGPIK